MKEKTDRSKINVKKLEIIIPIDLIIDINTNEIEKWELLEVINSATCHSYH